MIKLAAALLLSFYPFLAQANNPQCLDGKEAEELMKSRSGETRFAAGFRDAAGTVVVIYTNPETGTWTILSHFPNGIACIMGAGTLFERYPQGDPV